MLLAHLSPPLTSSDIASIYPHTPPTMSSNLNYTIESQDLVWNTTDADGASTSVIYNLGDMAWGMYTFL